MPQSMTEIPEPPDGTRFEFQEYGFPGGDLIGIHRSDASSAEAGWPSGDGGKVWCEYGRSVPITWAEVLADGRLVACLTGLRLVPVGAAVEDPDGVVKRLADEHNKYVYTLVRERDKAEDEIYRLRRVIKDLERNFSSFRSNPLLTVDAATGVVTSIQHEEDKLTWNVPVSGWGPPRSGPQLTGEEVMDALDPPEDQISRSPDTGYTDLMSSFKRVCRERDEARDELRAAIENVGILEDIRNRLKKLLADATNPHNSQVFPRDGVAQVEWGVRTDVYGKIYVCGVGPINYAKSFATHTRTITVWAVEGEPNDNWPRYISPWTVVER